jgi:hypothetical protein
VEVAAELKGWPTPHWLHVYDLLSMLKDPSPRDRWINLFVRVGPGLLTSVHSCLCPSSQSSS